MNNSTHEEENELSSEAEKVEAKDSTTEEAEVNDEKVVDYIEPDYKEKYLYLAAEMDNMRKRLQLEKEGVVKFGQERILSDLIEVVDNFERVVQSLKNDSDEKVKNIVIGINMVHKQFTDTLGNYGLEVIKTENQVFDPNLHEAISQEKREDLDDQVIISEVIKGYLLNGRVLRAAKVIVNIKDHNKEN